MSQTTIDDPELVEVKNVDSQGRVYLKSDLADKRVRVVVEVLNDAN